MSMVEYKSLSGAEIHAVFGNIKFGDLQMIRYAVQRNVAPIFTMGSADARAIAKGRRTINGVLAFSHLSTGGLIEAMRGSGNKVFLSHDELANYNAAYLETGQMSPEQRRALRAGGSLGYIGYVTEGDNSDLTQGNTLRSLGNNSPSGFEVFAVGTAFNNLSNYGRMTDAFLADQLPPFDITLVGVPESLGATLEGNTQGFKPQSMAIRGVQFSSESSGSSVEDLTIDKQMSFIARAISPWKKEQQG